MLCDPRRVHRLPDRPLWLLSRGLGEQRGDPVHAVGEILVAERVGQPEVGRRPKRLTGHDRDERARRSIAGRWRATS